MPILIVALLVMGAANTALRPITASLKVREDLDRLKGGDLMPANVGGHLVVASPTNIA